MHLARLRRIPDQQFQEGVGEAVGVVYRINSEKEKADMKNMVVAELEHKVDVIPWHIDERHSITPSLAKKIETCDDLRGARTLARLKKYRSIGLSAGASTSPQELENVKKFLQKI